MMLKNPILVIALLFVFSGAALADVGKVVRVVDGDTFLVESEGKSGTETVEVNLRCSDAPLVSSPFGAEAKKHLEQLLSRADQVSYKVQAYCGSERCVEALVYLPDDKADEVDYLNTEMIAAGLARNNGCRGRFESAEEEAKAAGKGIWSTTRKIAYAEPARTVAPAPEPTRTTARKPEPAEDKAPAVIRYDRVERTVTIKSRRISLTRIVKTIDTVSPSPINLYLEHEQYIAVNLEKVHWFDALQYLVETADLKQVNLDGKIDLYSRLFYYKHVSPYLKVAGNVGVYMNTGSSQKPLAKDDGTTRYVFINDFENSAEVAQQYKEAKQRNQTSGFIQVHEESGKAPASDYGLFKKEEPATPPVAVAAAEPAPSEPQRAPLRPYSGERPVEEQKAVAETPAPPVAVKAEPAAPAPVVKRIEPPAAPETKVEPSKEPAPEPAAPPPLEAPPEVARPDTGGKEREQAEPSGEPAAAGKPDTDRQDAPDVALAFSPLHAVAIVAVIAFVLAGCVFLTRSAGRRAAEAEKPVEPGELEEEASVPLDADGQVDRRYEKEIFEQLDHAAEPDSTTPEKAFEEASAAHEDDTPGEAVPEEERVASAGERENGIWPSEGSGEPEDAGVRDEVPTPGYDEATHGPKRAPRKICLFEVKCMLDGNSFTGIGLDISAGGMFVDSKETFAVGKVLELEFKLFEDDEKSIRCRGAVTWYNQRPDPIKPDYPNGFGVRFIDMDALTIEVIDRYLKTEDDGE